MHLRNSSSLTGFVAGCLRWLTGVLTLVVLPAILTAQVRPISGVVTDAGGNALSGVSISVKGQSQGTQTDASGHFSLNVPRGVRLIISSVNFESTEIVIGNQTNYSIALKPANAGLNEVVVVGYGSQKKINLTGNVSTVTSKQLEDRPITNLASALSGTAPGVFANQASGQPGAENVGIRIMGTGTLNNADPLVLVDGIESSMSSISPFDVESISVLKDAAAASIYGSRAANGVVLITTKKGRKGKPAIAYNASYGLSEPTHLVKLITYTPTIMDFTNEARANAGVAALYKDPFIQAYRDSAGIDPVAYPTTDWQKYLFHHGAITEHNLGLSGGSDNVLYNISLDYLFNKGILPSTSDQRFSVRANLDGTINPRLKYGNNLSVIADRVKGPTSLSSFYSFMGAPDTYPIYNGLYGGPEDGLTVQSNNGLAILQTQSPSTTKTNILDASYIQLEIIKGLIAKVNTGITYYQEYYDNFSYPVDYWNFRTNILDQAKAVTGGSVTDSYSRNYEFTIFPTLNYSTTLGGVHNIKILAGNSEQYYRASNFGGSGTGVFTNSTPVLSAVTASQTVNGGGSNWSMVSWFGRLNYDFKGKYLLEGVFRADASSRFAPSSRWGYFPAFSGGWRITDEPFAAPIKVVVDNLKLRGSWGKTGNNATLNADGSTNNYPYQSLYASNLNYVFGGAVTSGVGPTSLSNPSIKWETTTTTDAGLDADLFSNRLHVEGDYFHKLTDGILYQLSIPAYLGVASGPFVNLAQVQNDGWSVLASWRQKVTDKIAVTLGGNVTQIKNKVTKYQGPNVRTGGTFIVQEGKPINSIYGYKALGIFRSADEVAKAPTHYVIPGNANVSTSPGDIQYADITGDGKITPDDQTIIGNIIPKYTYGVNFSVQGYGFDLALLFNGVAKQDALVTGQYFQWAPEGSSGRNINARWLNHWSSSNPNAPMPRLIYNYSHNNDISSFWISRADYLRLRNAQLTYSLPAAWVRHAGMTAVRIYVNAQNPFTWTHFKGTDPEQPATNTTIGFPNLKVYTVGLNASF